MLSVEDKKKLESGSVNLVLIYGETAEQIDEALGSLGVDAEYIAYPEHRRHPREMWTQTRLWLTEPGLTVVGTSSHSLLYAAQWLVRNKIVTPLEVMVLYALEHPSSIFNVLIEIRMDTDGAFLDPWPEEWETKQLNARLFGPWPVEPCPGPKK